MASRLRVCPSRRGPAPALLAAASSRASRAMDARGESVRRILRAAAALPRPRAASTTIPVWPLPSSRTPPISVGPSNDTPVMPSLPISARRDSTARTAAEPPLPGYATSPAYGALRSSSARRKYRRIGRDQLHQLPLDGL